MTIEKNMLKILICIAGVFLPDLCEKQRTNPHRAMAELLSSGIAAAPMSSAEINAVFPAAEAPAPM